MCPDVQNKYQKVSTEPIVTTLPRKDRYSEQGKQCLLSWLEIVFLSTDEIEARQYYFFFFF